MTTALVLGGGGGRGAYEMGVWQALREMDIKIDIVTGSSIGAMNSVFIAQGAYDACREFWLTLKTEDIFDFKHAAENKGVRFTGIKDVLAEKVSEEAIRSSGIAMGIVTVEFPSMKPLQLWKEQIPEGKLMDYVFASCSCFPVVMPYQIDGKTYVDGGYWDNVPVDMALEKNPDQVIAVDLGGIEKLQAKSFDAAKDSLIMIKPSWDLGSMAVFSPEHSEEIMRLGYLDTFKAFKKYAGKRFTFCRAQFPQRELLALETAGEIFGLDPKKIYTREEYLAQLKAAIETERSRDISLDAIKSDLETGKRLVADAGPAGHSGLPELVKLLEKAKQSMQAGALAKRKYVLGLAELYSKSPALFKSASLKKLLGDELLAVQWLFAQDVI